MARFTPTPTEAREILIEHVSYDLDADYYEAEEAGF